MYKNGGKFQELREYSTGLDEDKVQTKSCRDIERVREAERSKKKLFSSFLENDSEKNTRAVSAVERD